tara:strand:- start:337 stop:714 length:378 start_codon:yes stop_codon:yes gene_type:complete
MPNGPHPDPTKRTPTLEEYGLSIKTNAMDIRTQAIAMPKVMGMLSSISSYTALPGHTLDAGVIIKNASNNVGDFRVKHDGATTQNATDGYCLAQGEEIFIPTNQASSVQVRSTGFGTQQASYKAY